MKEINMDYLNGQVITAKGHNWKIGKYKRKGRSGEYFPVLLASVRYKGKLYQKGIPLDSNLDEAKKLIDQYCEKKQVPQRE